MTSVPSCQILNQWVVLLKHEHKIDTQAEASNINSDDECKSNFL